MKKQGVIQSLAFGKGYGFIISTEEATQVKYFLHLSRVIKGGPAVIGAHVQFDVLSVSEGKSPSAINVEVLDGGAH
jgi:cold shock CspA family protein